MSGVVKEPRREPGWDEGLEPERELHWDSVASACSIINSCWSFSFSPISSSGSGGFTSDMARGEILDAFSSSSGVTG